MTRFVDVARQRALCEELWCHDGDPLATERAQLDLVLGRVARDRALWSDVFELSLGQHESTVDARRYSYAFPGWRGAPDDVEPFVRAWSDAAGPTVAQAARSVLRAVRHRAVEQVLVGYARGAAGPPRVKFYLQFANDAGTAPLALARSIVGLRRATRSDSLPLHLLGLDIGPGGLQGARLYFVRETQEAETTSRLCGGWAQTLRKVLLIHRVAGPDDDSADEPCEIDFAPGDSGLAWDAVWGSAALVRYGALIGRWSELASRYALRARRISLAIDGRRRATVYYVLDETGPSVTKPSGGA